MSKDELIDAESVLSDNIKDESEDLPDVEVPTPDASDIDVTEEMPSRRI